MQDFPQTLPQHSGFTISGPPIQRFPGMGRSSRCGWPPLSPLHISPLESPHVFTKTVSDVWNIWQPWFRSFIYVIFWVGLFDLDQTQFQFLIMKTNVILAFCCSLQYIFFILLIRSARFSLERNKCHFCVVILFRVSHFCVALNCIVKRWVLFPHHVNDSQLCYWS